MQTPLYDYHRAHARKMIDFHGWEMPLYYESIRKEHREVRSAAGVFDVSHMGKIILAGSGVADELRMLIPSKLPTRPGVCRYTHLLRKDGTILDDVILTCLDVDSYLCVCNAGPREEAMAWFERHLEGVVPVDRTFEAVCLALQGPEAETVLQRLVADSLAELRPFRGFATESAREVPPEAEGWVSLPRPFVMRRTTSPGGIYVTRTGYTGEDGFEIFAPNELGRAVWTQLVEEGAAAPVGLGARDTLRLEKGFLLSGQDFDGSQTPLHVGYAWLVDWDHEFLGRPALLRLRERGDYARLTGVRLRERGVPRPGQTLWRGEDRVGHLTSGTVSPTLGIGIGLGYAEPSATGKGERIQVEVRGRRLEAEVVEPPFL